MLIVKCNSLEQFPPPRHNPAPHAAPPPVQGSPVNLPATPSPENPSMLREDIRLLGKTLGDVIRQSEGREIYDVIEKLRRAAVKFRREGSSRDGELLKRQIHKLAGQDATSVTRAFTYFQIGRAHV